MAVLAGRGQAPGTLGFGRQGPSTATVRGHPGGGAGGRTPGFGGGGNWKRLFCGETPVRSIPIDPRGYAQQMESDFFRASVNWEVNDNIILKKCPVL